MRRSVICLAITCSMVGLLGASSLSGQEGVSSFSMAMSRAGMAPEFEHVRIEEFINYHRHAIPQPEGDQRVQLSLKWNRLSGNRAIVQVGLATPGIFDPDRMPPLNLVLVIDRSGSMSGDRIANVKKSLLAFVERLRPSDLVTIVGFSDEARVVLEPCGKTKQKEIRNAIEQIEANGSTNLHDGLMLGYKMAEQNFDPDRSNRVILLTDGIANVGTTNPKTIAEESKAFNNKAITLSTIGLGHDLNQDLLRDLADAGHGLIHFVADAADIEKTFIKELDSLLAPAASKVRLKIECENSRPERIFGYEPKSKGKAVSFRLDDLNYGATQVVLSEWSLKKMPSNIQVTLSYVDAVSGEKSELLQSVTLDESKYSSQQTLSDWDLNKNYTIAVLANSISEAARLAESDRYSESEQELSRSLKFSRKSSMLEADSDVHRVVKLVKNFRDSIRKHVSTNADRDR